MRITKKMIAVCAGIGIGVTCCMCAGYFLYVQYQRSIQAADMQFERLQNQLQVFSKNLAQIQAGVESVKQKIAGYDALASSISRDMRENQKRIFEVSSQTSELSAQMDEWEANYLKVLAKIQSQVDAASARLARLDNETIRVLQDDISAIKKVTAPFTHPAPRTFATDALSQFDQGVGTPRVEESGTEGGYEYEE